MGVGWVCGMCKKCVFGQNRPRFRLFYLHAFKSSSPLQNKCWWVYPSIMGSIMDSAALYGRLFIMKLVAFKTSDDSG